MSDSMNELTSNNSNDRISRITRNTNETEITIEINLDGGIVEDCTADGSATDDNAVDGCVAASGAAGDGNIGAINTGSGFLNHMLTLFAFHSGFTLSIVACGDTDVDYHHITEDIGIVLGQCIKNAIGDGKGITRYASIFLPMDETLVLISLDISGRTYLNYDVNINAPKVGDFDTELTQEFLIGLCRALGLTLHIKLLYGENAHHIIEAIFKGLGRALATAVSLDQSRRGAIPSTKGLL